MTYNFREISVLIADSQSPIITLIGESLRLLGVPPDGLHPCKNGKTALKVFQEKKLDLLIVDWDLSDLDGLDFIKAIRNSKENPYVPVIFMTALTTEKRVIEARDCGITEFLAKPFTVKSLSDRIEAIVERPRQFVLAPEYRGPDRRRKSQESYIGLERREPRQSQDLDMTKSDVFKDQKKVRVAEFITPPNILKQKMGAGGIDTSALAMAESYLEHNKVDFRDIGISLVYALHEGLQNSKQVGVDSETGIELMLYPAAQLKAQGAMFHYPFLTRIADILVTFLETVEVIDSDVYKIVEAHKDGFLHILINNITDHGGEYGKTLQQELLAACGRYYKTRKLTP